MVFAWLRKLFRKRPEIRPDVYEVNQSEDIYNQDKKERKEQKKKVKRQPKEFCDFCGAKTLPIHGHYCRYCDQYHCEKHLVPETHSCKGNPRRPPGTAGVMRDGYIYGK